MTTVMPTRHQIMSIVTSGSIKVSMTKNVYLIIVSILVILILSLLFFFVLPSFNFNNNTNDAVDVPLAENNSEDVVPALNRLYSNDGSTVASKFATARSIEEQGRAYADSARAVYETVKEEDGLSANEQANVDYRIALTYVHSDPEKAINEFKKIIDNDDYPDQQKAYAAQRMLVIWHFNRSVYEIDILPIIFAGNPYSDLLVEEDLNQSLINLAEFSLTFGSAPYSESRLAASKASQFVDGSDVEVREALLVEILEHFDSIDAYFERNRNVPTNASQEPWVRVNTADTMGQLAYAGVEDSIEDFASEYERAIGLNLDSPLEASLGFRYAWFAAAVENKDGGRSWASSQPYLARSLEIVDEHPGVISWLISRKDIPESPSRKMALILREKSPEFDAYLTANGW